MAYLTQFYTESQTNISINTAALIATITNSTRIRKLWINVFATDIAGNGDYTVYVTQQRAGAGVWYESIKTTKAVGVGIVSVEFSTIALTVNATDVIKVYLLGLAGDNTGAVDTITDVNEEWINIDASGRVDVGEWLGAVPAALSVNGYLQAMVLRWLTDNAGGTPNALSSGDVPADVKLWLAAAPAALSASGYVQSMLLRWLTDNAGGTPDALSSGKVPSDLKLWLAAAPAALTASGYLQSVLLRWLTDNAAGTPLALSTNLVQVADSAGVTTLLGRISATLFAGITSLGNWLRLMARKDAAVAADAAAELAEINVNAGSGAGAFASTTDSEEAIRDQVNTLVPGAATVLNAEITEIHVNP